MLFQPDTIEDDPALAQLVEEAQILRDTLMELIGHGRTFARLLEQRAEHEIVDAFRARNRAADGEAGAPKKLPDYSLSYSRLSRAIRHNIETWERVVPTSMRVVTRSPRPAPIPL